MSEESRSLRSCRQSVIIMNMHLSADHEHIDIAQLSAKIETSPTTDEDSTAIAQCADSLANVETGCADVEIAEIRSGVVTVEPKHGRNTGDVAGIISDEEKGKKNRKKFPLLSDTSTLSEIHGNIVERLFRHIYRNRRP